MDELIDLIKFLSKKYGISEGDINSIVDKIEFFNNKFINSEFKFKRALKDKSVIYSLLKKTSKDLIVSEKKYRSFVENIGDMIWETNLDGIFTYVSPQIMARLGYEASEMTGKSLLDIVPADYKLQFEKIFSQRKENLDINSQSFEHTYINSDTKQIYFETNTNVVLDDEGNHIGFNGVSRDITQRRITQEALLKSEQNLKAVVNSLDDLVLEVDDKLVFRNVWSSNEKNLFYTKDELLCKTLTEVFSNTDFRLLFETVIRDVIETGQTRTFEYESIVPNDDRYFEAKITMIKNDVSNENTVSILISDISQRKKAEFAIIKSKEEADRANKLKSEFLANMSHEIRTPMNAILGFAELLREKINEPKYENYLSGIITGGKNLLNIINDILDLSKIESGKIEMQYEFFNLSALTNEIYQIFLIKEQEKSVKFVVTRLNEIPDLLLLDEIRIRQVLINLIGNAFKFTSEGKVELILSCEIVQESKLNLTIQVKDTGIGIPEDQLGVIFEAFRQREGQNTRKYGGTGLGLTITRRLIQLMNGSINVTSQIGEGSIFTISFPEVTYSSDVIPKQLQKDVKEIEATTEFEFNNQLILLAEDIETNRMVVKGYLEKTNLKIIEAENGEDAFEMTKIYKPDLILMDIQMPIMDGIEASHKIKSEPWLKDIPIIALTASVMAEQIKLVTSVCDGFLKKPLSKNELYNTLKTYLKVVENSKSIQQEIKSNEFTEEVPKPKKSITVNQNLLLKLRNEILLNWNNVKNGMLIDEILEFAENLAKLGTENNCEELKTYGEDLYDAADKFKIERMTRIIENYPNFINEFIAK